MHNIVLPRSIRELLRSAFWPSSNSVAPSPRSGVRILRASFFLNAVQNLAYQLPCHCSEGLSINKVRPGDVRVADGARCLHSFPAFSLTLFCDYRALQGSSNLHIGRACVSLSDWPSIGRQPSTETRIVGRASPIQSGHVAIAASQSTMRCIMGFEVVATGEAALALRNPADI
jgi:hypothetical protein